MAIQMKQNHSKVNKWQARGPRYWCTPAFQYQCLRHQFWLFDAVSTLVVILQFLDHWHFLKPQLCLVWVHESPRTFGGTGPGFSDTLPFVMPVMLVSKTKQLQGIVIKCVSMFLLANLVVWEMSDYNHFSSAILTLSSLQNGKVIFCIFRKKN